MDTGWTEVPQATPSGVRFHTASQGEAEESARLRLYQRSGARLAVVDWGPGLKGALPAWTDDTPRALYQRFVDLGLRERVTLWALKIALPTAAYALLQTPEATTLFHSARETVLGRAPVGASPDEAAACLRALGAGETPRPPEPAGPSAESLSAGLANWFELFTGRLGPSLGWPRPEVERLGRQLQLGLKSLTSLPADARANALRAIGLETGAGDDGLLTARWSPLAPDRLAGVLLEAAADFAPNGAGALDALSRRGLRRQLEGLGPARSNVVADVLRLSASRLEAPVQTLALAPGDIEHVSWRLALTEPVDVETDAGVSDLDVFEPLRLDLAESGFGRMLEAVDELFDYAVRNRRELAKAGGRQLDLFQAQVSGEAAAGDVLEDPLNWVCRHALRLKVAPAYRELVAYLVASRLLDLRAASPRGSVKTTALQSLERLFENSDPQNAE